MFRGEGGGDVWVFCRPRLLSTSKRRVPPRSACLGFALCARGASVRSVTPRLLALLHVTGVLVVAPAGKAAFALYPNGVVVHFGCCKDKHVCPVSGTRFADALKLDAVVGTLSGVTTRSRRHSSVSSDLWTRLRAHSGLGQAPPPPSSTSRRIASARASRAAPPAVPLRSGRRGSARG